MYLIQNKLNILQLESFFAETGKTFLLINSVTNMSTKQTILALFQSKCSFNMVVSTPICN
jgi:hypothetical protein